MKKTFLLLLSLSCLGGTHGLYSHDIGGGSMVLPQGAFPPPPAYYLNQDLRYDTPQTVVAQPQPQPVSEAHHSTQVTGNCNFVCVCPYTEAETSTVCVCPVKVSINPLVNAALNLLTCGTSKATDQQEPLAVSDDDSKENECDINREALRTTRGQRPTYRPLSLLGFIIRGSQVRTVEVSPGEVTVTGHLHED